MLMKSSSSLLLVTGICVLFSLQLVVADSSIVNRHDIIEALSEPPSRGIKVAPKKVKKEKIQIPAEQTVSEEIIEEVAEVAEVAEVTEVTEVVVVEDAPEAQSTSAQGLVVLDIKFEFNSSVLSPSAISQLEELGAALSSAQLNTGVFEVSGHTDSKGSAAYNKSLSLKRAQSVENYLLTNFKLAQSRLHSLGYGEEKPIFVSDTANGANRRVEIRRTQ
jgi:outer membrane protein OmpA-like peptidoglycan-associated protein